jgi:cytochrome c
LYGLLGRRVAADPGYAYSDEVRSKDFRWTPEQLDQLLRQPSEILPRSRMTMIPIARPKERADLIAYLQTLADP